MLQSGNDKACDIWKRLIKQSRGQNTLKIWVKVTLHASYIAMVVIIGAKHEKSAYVIVDATEWYAEQMEPFW